MKRPPVYSDDAVNDPMLRVDADLAPISHIDPTAYPAVWAASKSMRTAIIDRIRRERDQSKTSGEQT
jgi:hypothetical protein